MSDVAKELLESRMRKTTIKENVKRILERHPSAKGDYRILDYYFWREIHGVKISLNEFNQLRQCTAPGVIERRYRELVAEDEPQAAIEGRANKYKPSNGTTSKRLKNFEVYRDYYNQQGALRHWTEEGGIG